MVLLSKEDLNIVARIYGLIETISIWQGKSIDDWNSEEIIEIKQNVVENKKANNLYLATKDLFSSEDLFIKNKAHMIKIVEDIRLALV